ncbi:MAG: hypothetical protein AB1705_26335 [Verrucomicrobiota bacterium]
MSFVPVTTPEFRKQCADRLAAARARVPAMAAFIGLDGFVDEIIHVVDKRKDAESFKRLPTIASLAERLASAAGKSTNIELVKERVKLGGNGPIMANALAVAGLKVTYVGALGFPAVHPVFEDLGKRAEVHSVAEAAHTDALEFEDGKLMLGKMTPLNELTWPNIQARFGRDRFAEKLASADLVGFVNWTMVPYMSDIWEALLKELCPGLRGPKRKLFFDLADPEKRTQEDILRALKLIEQFSRYFNVILGLNEREAFLIGRTLGVNRSDHSPDGVAQLALEIHRHVPVDTLAVHPVTYALAVSKGTAVLVAGPHIAKPAITTGAGDHFNAGFCLAKLLGLPNDLCVLTGVCTSGFYVQNARTPNLDDLIGFLTNWPVK